MYILSIDVGIKNLAHCLLNVVDSSYTILAWDSIDLSKDYIIYCNNSNCNNLAKCSLNNINYCQKHSKSLHNTKNVDQIKVSDISLPKIGLKLKENYDKIFNNTKIDIVIIENQLSPLASRMKTLQGMITQYFIDNNVTNIEYISATNKLKEYSDKKMSYNERKKLSVQTVKDKLKDSWLEYFIKNKKKDDLADTLLQALFYIKLMRRT